eukprot:TRINITY_DN19085_c0_g1_i1.p2 TRINITY_DN19085_c0_g1~~TRINITY_DN19085_c0_g1_i1.p2  ORF type:complete len:198 (+),score=7.94 TRINITY_DN19085_c0_g1_i1:276-869(+)
MRRLMSGLMMLVLKFICRSWVDGAAEPPICSLPGDPMQLEDLDTMPVVAVPKASLERPNSISLPVIAKRRAGLMEERACMRATGDGDPTAGSRKLEYAGTLVTGMATCDADECTRAPANECKNLCPNALALEPPWPPGLAVDVEGAVGDEIRGVAEVTVLFVVWVVREPKAAATPLLPPFRTLPGALEPPTLGCGTW